MKIFEIVHQKFNSPGFIKYISNTSWLFAEKIISLPILLLISILVARYLGPENLGKLNFAISFVSIFSAFATLGIDPYIVRDLVEDKNSHNQIMGTSFILKMIGSFILLAICLIGILFYNYNFETSFLIVLVGLSWLIQAFYVIDLYFQSIVQTKLAVISRLITLITISIIKILFIKYEIGIIWFAFLILTEAILNSLNYIIFYKKKSQKLLDWKFSFDRFKKSLKMTGMLFLAGMAINIQGFVDQFMLGEMINKIQLGYYVVALNLINVFAFIPIIIQSAFAPAVTNARLKDIDAYHDRLLNLYRLVFIVFLLISIPCSLFSKFIIQTLYGSQYAPSVLIFSILAFRLFLTNFGIIRSLFFVNENFYTFYLISSIIGAISNIILNYVFISTLGVMGAILSSFISFIITIFIVDLFIPKTRKNVHLMVKAILTFYKINITKELE